jgi:hypothetical protein
MVRKIKAKLVLRLRAEGLTGRQIAAQDMSRTSVASSSNGATTRPRRCSAPNRRRKDWHQRLGGGVHADAIMDRIVHNTH